MMPAIFSRGEGGSAGAGRTVALLLVVALGLQLLPFMTPGRTDREVASGDVASSFIEPLNVCEEGDCFTGLCADQLWLPEAVFCFVQTAGGLTLWAPVSRGLCDGHRPEVFKPPRVAAPSRGSC
jgi:hypothetical protein